MKKEELFKIKVGDTDRRVEEVVSSLRQSDLPITHIDATSDSIGKLAAGTILTVHVAAENLSEEQFKQQLNEYGGCMYQVESVVKASK